MPVFRCWSVLVKTYRCPSPAKPAVEGGPYLLDGTALFACLTTVSRFRLVVSAN